MVEYRKNVCLFCNSNTKEESHSTLYFIVDCPLCGVYFVEYESRFFLESESDYPKFQRNKIAKELKRRKNNGEPQICILKDNCYDVKGLDESVEIWMFRDLRRVIDRQDSKL